MARSVFDAPQFKDEAAAFAYVEGKLWPHGPVCPHCGTVDNATAMKGATTRQGLYKCKSKECRKPFTVRMGTIFESSHLPLRLWLQVIHLMCASKKGISARQIQRMLDCSMKTAWFLAHRIREAMADGSVEPFGSAGTAVEADETFLGINPNARRVGTPIRNMNAILTIVDRASGRARSQVIDRVDAATVAPILQINVSRKARLMTDYGLHYFRHGWLFAQHGRVNHSAHEYVKADDASVHTNTVEGTFSVFKRGMRGVYQHCSRKHLHRYLSEFDFRYSNRAKLGVDDAARADTALRGVAGKRLTYRTVSERRAGAEERLVW